MLNPRSRCDMCTHMCTGTIYGESRECNNFTFIFCKEIIKILKNLARSARAKFLVIWLFCRCERNGTFKEKTHPHAQHICHIFINNTVHLYYNVKIPLTIPVPLYGFRAGAEKDLGFPVSRKKRRSGSLLVLREGGSSFFHFPPAGSTNKRVGKVTRLSYPNSKRTLELLG